MAGFPAEVYQFYTPDEVQERPNPCRVCHGRVGGKPVIEEYDFGKLRVAGKEYRRDVIIYHEGGTGSERVDASWWRKQGHRLDKTDLEEVVKARPEVLVVGTGYHGCMSVPKETADFLQELEIMLFAAPTKEACQKYNELKDIRRLVAVLHLTC